MRRQRLLARIRRSIERESFPRWQLSLIVVLTGVAGLLVSLGLLRLGLEHMGWRYLLAFVSAYGLFLGLLNLWARTYRESSAYDFLDVPSGGRSSSSPESVEGGGTETFEAGGGNFGGGGASDAWDSGVGLTDAEVAASDSVGGSADLLGSALPDVDLDEGVVVLLPLAVIFTGLVAVVVVLYSAPVLLAELVLDVVILGGVYRRIRGLEPQNWLLGALRRTWLPALGLGVLLVGLGFVLELLAPGARTIGEAFARF